MTARRLLFLDANHLSAYHWQNGHLRAEGEFAADEPGLEAFGEYLKAHASSLFTLLADVPEEGFQIEDIPRVQGRDRQAIISRRLGQYFYGSPYATALSLGREATGRKDEKMLFAALTRPPQIDAWMAVIKATGCQLTALHSAPFLVTELHKGLATPAERLLLLTVGKSGLRQTYFEKGQFRFSRLTPLVLGNIEEVAQACVDESEKIYQYLVGQRLLERAAHIRTQVFCHPAEQAVLQQRCRGNGNLSFEFVDLPAEAARRGLKTPLKDSHSELLLLHLLIRAAPASQFAPAEYRRPYRIWQLRFGLNAIAIIGLAACLLFAAKTALNGYGLQQDIAQVETEVANEKLRYEAMLKTLPSIPLKLDDLRALVDRFSELEKRSPRIKASLIPLSRALDAVPAVELQQVDWVLSANPEDSVRGPSQNAKPPAPTPAPGGIAPPPPIQGSYFAIMEIQAKLPVSYANDHRTLLTTVDAFRDALQKNPDITTRVLRMPFDTESGKTIKSSGDNEAARAEAPDFQIRIVQRIY